MEHLKTMLVLWAVMCIVIVSAVSEYGVVNDHRNPYDIYEYRDHPCRRACEAGAPPMTCHYYFLLEHYTTMSSACYDCPANKTSCDLSQCVTGDGTARGLLTANRMVPGPKVYVCKNDTIEVMIDNRMELGEGTSIHWHGIRQLGTPHMDGTNLVTQCPVHRWSTMKYSFQAVDTGTHFWHAHSSMQRAEGLFGGLIIREPKSEDPQGHLYDQDLAEHYILLADWTKKMSGEAFAQDFHGGITTEASSILINGRGGSGSNDSMPLLEFHVEAGQRYRFRMAYNGILNCPIYVRIDGHPLLMIATDGEDFEPLEVDAFMIFSGERYDFVLNAKEGVKGAFWMRFKGHGRCLASQTFQAAILRYNSAEADKPEGEATFKNTIESKTEKVLNGRSRSPGKSFQIVDLNALPEANEEQMLKAKPAKQFYISIGASEIVDERFLPPPHPFLTTEKPPPVRPFNHQLNYISSRLPPSPPLSQYDDLPQDLICNNSTMTYDCSKELCVCVHMLKYDIGDLVEIVLVSYKNTLIHPMHMHGHSYKVVTMHRFGRDITVDEIKQLNEQGKIPRKTSKAPRKDTLAVPEQAVTIIRFKADNPGFWFFHCHIEFHAELGMQLILQEGQPSEMPPPPEEFPSCQSWKPSRSSKDKGHRRKNKVEGQAAQNQVNSTSDSLTIGQQTASAFTFSLGIALSCIASAGIALMLFVSFRKKFQNRKIYEPVLIQEFESYDSIQ